MKVLSLSLYVKIVLDRVTRFLDPESSCPLPKTSQWRRNKTPRYNWDDLTSHKDSLAESEEDEEDEEFYDSVDEMDHDEDEWKEAQGEVNSAMDDTADPNSYSNSQFEKNGVPLYIGSEITILLIFSFSLRHSLTSSTVEDLLKLLNVFLPSNNILPQSLHLFRKLFHDPSESLNVHLFCNICKYYKWSQNQSADPGSAFPDCTCWFCH